MMKGMVDLKSNMDRFIVIQATVSVAVGAYLKSNMDRFIVVQN